MSNYSAVLITTLNIRQPSDLYIQVKREKVEQSFCLRKNLMARLGLRPGPPDPVEMLTVRSPCSHREQGSAWLQNAAF